MVNTDNLHRYNVLSTSSKGNKKNVTLSSETGKTIKIQLHKYAVVSQGNILLVDKRNHKRIFIENKDELGNPITVYPTFDYNNHIQLDKDKLKVVVRELITSEDFSNYSFLEKFHYKTSVLVNNGKNSAANGSGKKVVLIAYLHMENGLPTPVGYIELQMPLQMVKPRHVLFDNEFHHPHKPINWTTWNIDSIKKYLNHIVRIARVVTTPEYRGLGLSKILLSACIKFSKERWHSQGQKPIFIEILAEMLKYMDFVSSSGLIYIGDTEGNLKRIQKDMTYMLRDYQTTTGIMSLQKKYLTSVREIAAELGRDVNEIIEQIASLVANPDVEFKKLSPSHYFLFKKIIRTPIPYFLLGLDEYTNDYIKTFAESSNKSIATEQTYKTRVKNLAVVDLSIDIKMDLNFSDSVRHIMDAFGLSGDKLCVNIIEKFNIRTSPGNLIFISGPSGSGKSILLKAFDPNFFDNEVLIKSKSISTKYKTEWMKSITSDKPIIEYFSSKWGMDKSISALNQAGLSEAFVYIKPFKLLSRGQKYRAQIAQLLLSDADVWLVDEFCSDLDPITAKVLAKNLRKMIIKQSKIAFIAAANHAHYIHSLKPTLIVKLRQGAKPVTVKFAEYKNELFN